MLLLKYRTTTKKTDSLNNDLKDKQVSNVSKREKTQENTRQHREVKATLTIPDHTCVELDVITEITETTEKSQRNHRNQGNHRN